MPTTTTQKSLSDSSTELCFLIKHITSTAIGGNDSHAYAAKISALAQDLAKASSAFYETLSEAHCETLDIGGETPCEDPADFAGWSRRAAHDRSYVPFEGRPVSRAYRPVIDLRAVLQAAE